MARLSLKYLAGVFALAGSATEDEVADALEAELKAGKEARAHAVKLEADVLALSAKVQQAESARDAALLALESLPPPPVAPEPVAAPAPAGKFKPGDDVLYQGSAGKVKAVMGPEMVCELEDGRCAPDSRLEAANSPAAVAFQHRVAILESFAAGIQGHTITPDKLRAMAMVDGIEGVRQAIDTIKASVPANTQRQAVARGVLEALAPNHSAIPDAGGGMVLQGSTLVIGGR